MKALLVFLALVCLAQSHAAAAKPDVLVILTDQWSPRYLSWENPQVRTPHLDRIAGEGKIFDACYTTSPVCMPARISLITGLYPHNAGHSVWGNVTDYCVPPAAAAMFRDIQRAGYTTAQIGKTHWTSGTAWKEQFATIAEYFRALGLDHVTDVPGPPDSARDRGAYAQHLKKLGLLEAVAADLHERYVKGEFEPRPSLVKVEDYHDSFVTNEATAFIREQPKETPLCLVVSLHSPHPPLDAPAEFATMFDPESLTLPANVPETFLREGHALDRAATRKVLANYLGKIALVDRCIGQLVEAMQQRGTWENTLVIFTADHGEMMGAHGYLTKGRFYEESARVPLVVRWPGHVQPGRTKALAQMMDAYPTIVEAIGGELSPGRFARSLLPVAMGRAESVRSLAVSEIGTVAPLRVMSRDARYKWWAEEDREFLFDLEADPLELRNLATSAESRETLQRMREQMLLHLRSTQINLAAGYKSKVQRLREAESSSAPNILFIAVDDLRPELGCYGAPHIQSPNIDRLAAGGLLFERAYCQQAVCNPSRASVLSGCRPDTTGVMANHKFLRPMMPDVVTLPQHFKNHGWHTASLGKIFHHSEKEPGDDPQSWSEPSWHHGEPHRHWFAKESDDFIKRLKKLPEAERPRLVRGPPFEAANEPDEVYPDGQTAAKAIATLRRLKESNQPFFLGVGFVKPHLPFTCPQKYWDWYPADTIKLPDNYFPTKGAPEPAFHDGYELRTYGGIPAKGGIGDDTALNLIRGYRACISFMDAQVGRVLAELDRLGLRDHTIVVLWGDHGYHLGENGVFTKMTNFELGTRAPLIVSVPGQKTAGKRTRALIELVDLYPTLAEWSGLPLPPHLEGTSFAPLLSDPGQPWKQAAFSQYLRPGKDQIMGRSMRTDRWRYTEWVNGKAEKVGLELYDEANDPRENVNVAGEAKHRNLVAQLAKQLRDGWRAAAPAGR